jgi:hypothetical protein
VEKKKIAVVSAFRDGGSLSRRVNVAACPSPDGGVNVVACPGPSFYRRKERIQVYNGGCSRVLRV